MLPIQFGEHFRAVSVAEGYSCAIAITGSLWCWGAFPPLAFSAHYSDRAGTPLELVRGLDFVAVSTTPSSICAMTAAGRIHCF
jgi:hypothetical protein